METVVMVLMIVVCFNYLLKQTYRKIYFVLFSAVVSALFVGLMWPYAIEQSKTQIADWLNNPDLMRDTAVVLSLDVILQLSYCMLAANMMTTGLVSPRTLWVYKFLRWFPGIMIYPVLFSILVATIFAFPGTSFQGISWTLAAIVAVLIPGGAYAIKWLLPEKDLRLEILFLTNALIAILGVISTVNGQTTVAGQNEVNWGAVVGIAGIIVCGAAIGMCLRHFLLKRKINKQFYSNK